MRPMAATIPARAGLHVWRSWSRRLSCAVGGCWQANRPSRLFLLPSVVPSQRHPGTARPVPPPATIALQLHRVLPKSGYFLLALHATSERSVIATFAAAQPERLGRVRIGGYRLADHASEPVARCLPIGQAGAGRPLSPPETTRGRRSHAPASPSHQEALPGRRSRPGP